MTGQPVPEVWVPTAALGPRVSKRRPATPAAKWNANWFGPHEAMRVNRRPVRPWNISKAAAALLLGATLLLIGVQLVDSALSYGDGPPSGLAFTSRGLIVGSLFTLALFTTPSFFWVAAFYSGGVSSWRWRLALRTDNAVRDWVLGAGLAFPIVILAAVGAATFGHFGGPVDNPVVAAIGPALTWPTVIVIALSAGIGEELFFRGLLQGRIGIVPANILFGLVHLDYGTPLQVILPLLLGFIFSWLMIRTRSLYPAIAAHAGFDAIMLSLAKLAEDLGWATS